MNCPNCGVQDIVEFDKHSVGFCEDSSKCGSCGTVWVTTDEKVQIITKGRAIRSSFDTVDSCPVCHSVGQVEICQHSDGHATGLMKCGYCRASWCAIGENINIASKLKNVFDYR